MCDFQEQYRNVPPVRLTVGMLRPHVKEVVVLAGNYAHVKVIDDEEHFIADIETRPTCNIKFDRDKNAGLPASEFLTNRDSLRKSNSCIWLEIDEDPVPTEFAQLAEGKSIMFEYTNGRMVYFEDPAGKCTGQPSVVGFINANRHLYARFTIDLESGLGLLTLLR